MDIANSADRHSRPSIEKYNVAILLFEAVEVLDFAGPFEVFSRTRLTPGVESRRSDETAPFRVFTVAKKDEAVTTTGDLKVVPHYSFRTARPIDLLVVPGGNGTRALLSDHATLDWIRVTAGTAKKVTSVCTGALSLAQAGLLDRKRATTHWGALNLRSKSVTREGLAFQSSTASVLWTTASSRPPAFPPTSIWLCTSFSSFVERQSRPRQRITWNMQVAHAAKHRFD
jgi:putative intracellular protease/amidase